MKGNFFASPTEESLVKINIVTKYFAAWAQIISKFKNKIRYIDLFCGPGIYEDGTKSTPLIVLENAINSPKICASLISIFNDKTTDFTDVLRDEIESMPKISRLTHKPIITNIEICENNIGQLTSVKHIPTLLFADPWGYKGLTMELFASFLKEKYSEAIFFFNYQFINAYFESNPVEEHFGSIIGSNKIEELKSVLPGLSPRERNDVIMDSLKSAFQIEGEKYKQEWHVLPFAFESKHGGRSTHYIVYVTKDARTGLKIMKDIMKKISPSSHLPVSPLSHNQDSRQQPKLFETNCNILSEQDLSKELLNHFSGKTIEMTEIFNTHHSKYDYFVFKNYQTAVRILLDQGKVTTSHFNRNVKNTILPSKTLVTFPLKEKK